MEIRHALISFICLFSLPAVAVQPNELGVTESDCKAIVEHIPTPDAEYKPGVDVNGKPVVEADLTPAVVTPLETYSFPLTVDVARYIGISVPEGIMGEARIGMITLENGKVLFNGNPLEGNSQAALRAICAPKTAPETPEKSPK